MKKVPGFTIVEMLVVLVVIGILAALITAVSSKMRESARVVSCQSNLTIIGRAILMYASANKGFLPGGQPANDSSNSTAFVTSLLPYRHVIPYIVPGADPDVYRDAPPPAVCKCPSDDEIFGALWDDGLGYTSSYLYNTVELTNGTVIDSSSSNGIHYISPNHAQSRLASWFDYTTNWHDGINEPSGQEMMIDSAPFEEGQEGTSYRHFKSLGLSGEGSNVLFLDGHVEFIAANPDDIEFESGFDFLIDADPLSAAVRDRYWIRWIARKY